MRIPNACQWSCATFTHAACASSTLSTQRSPTSVWQLIIHQCCRKQSRLEEVCHSSCHIIFSRPEGSLYKTSWKDNTEYKQQVPFICNLTKRPRYLLIVDKKCTGSWTLTSINRLYMFSIIQALPIQVVSVRHREERNEALAFLPCKVRTSIWWLLHQSS